MRLRAELTILFVFLLISIASQLSATPIEKAIAGRSVSGDLVKAADLAPAAMPAEKIELTTNSVTVRPNNNIYDLLTANGIEPDVEAFTLVYDLNPSLKEIDPLPAGLTIVLPKVTGEDELQQKLRSGYLLMLTVDPALREDLGRNVSQLKDLARRFPQVAATRFNSESERASMIANVSALSVWLDNVKVTFLHRTGPPLRQQTLLGLRDETLALNSILSTILDGQAKVSPEEQQQVASIYRDVEVQMKKYDNIMAGEPPAAEKRYEVVVTIRDADQLKNPQVYYTLEGLFRKPPKEPFSSQPFEKAVSGFLTFGDYIIWVGQPDHPFPPLTDQKPIRIEAAGASPKSVVLSVLK